MPGAELTDDQLDRLDLYRDPAVRAGLAYQERQRAAMARDIEMVERTLELAADESEDEGKARKAWNG